MSRVVISLAIFAAFAVACTQPVTVPVEKGAIEIEKGAIQVDPPEVNVTAPVTFVVQHCDGGLEVFQGVAKVPVVPDADASPD